jgi:threonine synthase
LPKMLGFQAAGAAPIVKGKPIKHPKTIATAIKIGNPASWSMAVDARDESGGLIDMVTDAEILKAYKLLAQREGVFVEPASAASVAGVIKLASSGYFRREKAREKGARLVCILTGHGLKDPDRAMASIKPPKVLKPTMSAILKEIGL